MRCDEMKTTRLNNAGNIVVIITLKLLFYYHFFCNRHMSFRTSMSSSSWALNYEVIQYNTI